MTPRDTHFTFIRHGETDWNRQQRFQGQIDVPLNANGWAQARRMGARLAGEPADGLVCSDLIRTQQTAAPLAEAWGRRPLLLPGLREQCFGVLEGMDVPGIKQRYPALWQDWLQHHADFVLPGGESLRQFHGRVMAVVDDLAARHRGRHLVVVTHGGVLDMLWRSAHQQPLDGLRRCDIPNTGLNRLRWQAGRLFIERWADAAHLQGLPEQAGSAAGER